MDPAIASIIGAIITAVASIAVAIITSRAKNMGPSSPAANQVASSGEIRPTPAKSRKRVLRTIGRGLAYIVMTMSFVVIGSSVFGLITVTKGGNQFPTRTELLLFACAVGVAVLAHFGAWSALKGLEENSN